MTGFTRLALLVTLGLCLVAALGFGARQNRAGTRGGRISRPKLVWLFFAIWFWLFECAALAFEPALPWGYRVLFGVHAASMWLRGVAELFLLHVTKTWRPPMGIGHDVFCVATVLALLVACWEGLGPTEPFGLFAPSLVVMLLFSLVVEILYATLFFRAVEGKTTGDDGVWFASEEEARFRRINRLTFAFNVPQVAFQLVFLGAALRW